MTTAVSPAPACGTGLDAAPTWYTAAAQFLGGFPEQALVIDTETVGLDPASPMTWITQIGYAVVQQGVCQLSDAVVLNWAADGPARIEPGTYVEAIDRVTREMAARGSCYRITPEMALAGAEPVAALADFRDMIADAAAQGWAVVGHNIYRYDRPLLEHWFRRLGYPFTFDVERLVDTGLIEKARRLGGTPPLPGQCRREEWYAWVAGQRSRVRWALAGACDEEYGLFARIGGDDHAHDAGFDCLLTAHLLAALRERAA